MSETRKPKYIKEADQLKVVVYDEQGGFDFDSFYIFDPTESKSGAWEVWHTEWTGDELQKGDVIKKLIEIHSEWVTCTEHVHLVCQCLSMGYDAGEQAGVKQMQSCAKYAFAALTGDANMMELHEAAYQNGFGWRRRSGQ